MRKPLGGLAAALALSLSGCAWLAPLTGAPGSGPADPAAVESAFAQLQTARLAFEKKINAAPGLTLAELRSLWPEAAKSFTRNRLTVYRWARTATVTPPAEASEPAPARTAGPQTQVFSCLAMFIVNQDGVVVDATSEGQCLDYKLMPLWRPVINADGDGRRKI